MSDQTRPCEVCGQPIDPERVEVIPETRLCIDHAREANKYGGEFILTAHMDRTSKAGSLKKNYGGVTPSRRRNEDAVARLKADHRKRQADATE